MQEGPHDESQSNHDRRAVLAPLTAQLRGFLVADLKDPRLAWRFQADSAGLGGTFVDLNAERQDGFVLIRAKQASAYTDPALASGGAPDKNRDREKLLQQLLSGAFEAREPALARTTRRPQRVPVG